MKLGELFVDLGVNSGGAFNTLSGFAFKLTNISQLAEKATRWTQQLFGKDTSKWATDILYMARSLDLSAKSIQGLGLAANKFDIPLGSMVNKLQKLDEEWVSFLQGKNKGFIEKMAWFGLNNDDIRTARDSLDLMQKMIERSSRISNTRMREAFRREYGFSSQETDAWFEFYKKRAQYENDERVRSTEELEKYRELNIQMNELATNYKNVALNLKSDILPELIDITKWMNEFTKSGAIEKEIREDASGLWKGIKWGAKALSGWTAANAFGEELAWVVNEYGDNIGAIGKKIGGYLGAYNNTGLLGKTGATAGMLAIPGGQFLAAGMAANVATESVTTAILNIDDWLKRNTPSIKGTSENTRKLLEEAQKEKTAAPTIEPYELTEPEGDVEEESPAKVGSLFQGSSDLYDDEIPFEDDVEYARSLNKGVGDTTINDNKTFNIFTNDVDGTESAITRALKKELSFGG